MMKKSRAKPKAKGTSRASKPRKSPGATKTANAASKSPKAAAKGKSAKAGAKPRPAAGDWRDKTLAEIRRMIHAADPDIVEERKWIKPSNPAGVPVWSRAGIVCTGETYKEVVKLTFMRGASLKDPRGLFNSSLEGNARRAIDIREGLGIDARAFKALIEAAVAENLRSGGSTANPKSAKALTKTKQDARTAKSSKARKDTNAKPIKLLAGGNPQIAKADGDAPVQVYIAALTGWKRDVAERLDALIARSVPKVRKAVKWNSPFYGVEGQGWFVSFHVFTRYLKVAFFGGASLRPVPPGGTGKDARWIDIHEGDLDERQLATQLAGWLKQAAALPGWMA
jgi:hypothetical protein